MPLFFHEISKNFISKNFFRPPTFKILTRALISTYFSTWYLGKAFLFLLRNAYWAYFVLHAQYHHASHALNNWDTMLRLRFWLMMVSFTILKIYDVLDIAETKVFLFFKVFVFALIWHHTCNKKNIKRSNRSIKYSWFLLSRTEYNFSLHILKKNPRRTQFFNVIINRWLK